MNYVYADDATEFNNKVLSGAITFPSRPQLVDWVKAREMLRHKSVPSLAKAGNTGHGCTYECDSEKCDAEYALVQCTSLGAKGWKIKSATGSHLDCLGGAVTLRRSALEAVVPGVKAYLKRNAHTVITKEKGDIRNKDLYDKVLEDGVKDVHPRTLNRMKKDHMETVKEWDTDSYQCLPWLCKTIAEQNDGTVIRHCVVGVDRRKLTVWFS